MEKVTKKLTETSPWTGTTAVADLAAVKLPREGLITEIGIWAEITLNGSTFAAAKQPDSMRRVLNNIIVQGDGGRDYFNMSGEQFSRILGLWNIYELHCPMISYLSAITEHILFVLHPGSNPRDPFDMSAVIPAQALDALQIQLQTDTYDCVDDTQTITTASVFRYYINEVMDVPVPRGIMTPCGSSRSINQGVTVYADHSLEIDVPTGKWLRRIFILVQDEAAVKPLRAEDEVTQLKLKMPKTARSQIDMEWIDLKLDCAKTAGVPCVPLQVADAGAENIGVPDGFAIVDLRKYFHPLWGANLTNYQKGDVKLGLSVPSAGNAGDDILIYFDTLMPVEDKYVGK